jgi:chloramphenicol 3-O-phosphotransferase
MVEPVDRLDIPTMHLRDDLNMQEFIDRPKAVVLITGISAAGKSTVAQGLAERLPHSVHVRGDLFRRMIVNGRAEMTSGRNGEALRQLRLRYRLAASTADAYFAAGFTAVVQDVIIGPELDHFISLVRSRPLIVVVLAPDASTVAARDLQRSKTGYRDWTIEQLDHGMRSETPRIGLWLDTSGQTPSQTVDEILSRAWDEAAMK